MAVHALRIPILDKRKWTDPTCHKVVIKCHLNARITDLHHNITNYNNLDKVSYILLFL